MTYNKLLTTNRIIEKNIPPDSQMTLGKFNVPTPKAMFTSTNEDHHHDDPEVVRI